MSDFRGANTPIKSSPAREDSPAASSETSSVFFNDNQDMRKDEFSCENCEGKFISKEMLDLHEENCQGIVELEQSNSQKGSFACNICDKICISPFGLKLHQSRMHRRAYKSAQKKKPSGMLQYYQCSFCDYRSKQKASVKTHERIHTDERPYVCDYCGEKFRWQTTMLNHKKKHSKETFSKTRLSSRSSATGPLSRSSPRVPAPSTPSSARHPPFELSASSASSSASARYIVRSAASSSSRRSSQSHQQQSSTSMALQTYKRETEEDEDGEDVIPVNQQNYSYGRGANGSGAAVVSHYSGMVINACAQGNMVTFHDVDTTRGMIGKITFQFMCNACRGERGVARCFRGRAYCVMCCGHPDCD